METQNSNMPMLELLLRPAFCVSDGKITEINTQAAPYLLSAGTEILPLLATGQQEYRDFTEGCLYLTLCIGSQPLGATVVALDKCHLFLLEQADNGNLQALALAARELRGPLSGMISTMEQLQASADPQQLAQMNRRLYQSLRIVSNMSDAALFSQSSGPMEYLEICSFLQELLDKTGQLLKSADIQLKYQLPNQPVYTLADAPKLERAVYNLISNAAKHTPANGCIRVTLANRGRLYLSVTDEGPGIPSGVMSSLYSRYLRTPSITDGQDGIGLGMVLVRAAATLHGGTVLIDHPQSGGTRVTMTVALQKHCCPPVRSPILHMDYAGERDHSLQELADVLPAALYAPENLD